MLFERSLMRDNLKIEKRTHNPRNRMEMSDIIAVTAAGIAAIAAGIALWANSTARKANTIAHEANKISVEANKRADDIENTNSFLKVYRALIDVTLKLEDLTNEPSTLQIQELTTLLTLLLKSLASREVVKKYSTITSTTQVCLETTRGLKNLEGFNTEELKLTFSRFLLKFRKIRNLIEKDLTFHS
jgi:hypothetical protein